MNFYKINTLSRQNLTLVPCPICDGANYRDLGIDNGFRIVKCLQADCGYVFVNPRPSQQQLKEFYDSYYPPGGDTAAAWTKEMMPINREVARILKKFSATGRVLDIGSSFGQFLAEAEKMGWEGTGVESSPSAAAYAQTHTKSKIIQGLFEDAELEPGHFDAVVSLYVLEHVLDPVAFMKKIYHLLRPGGMAVIRVPHTEPLMPLFRMLGRPLLEAPMHLNDFSPHTFKKLSVKAGFSKCDASIGALRRASDPVVRFGSLVLGGTAQLLEMLTFGKYLSPLSGAKQYILIK